MKRITKLCSILCMLCITTNLLAQDIYVDINAAGNNDGTSWTDAYADVSTAINSAYNGYTVHIAQGTYMVPRINIEQSITVIGGYDSATGAIDTNLYPTILDGQGTNRIFVIGDYIDNNGKKTVTVEGITFQNGSSNSGGAIYIYGEDTLNITDCILRNNISSNQGGAIYNLGEFTIKNTSLVYNSAVIGGAIYVFSVFSNATNECLVINSKLSNNTASDSGGAIHLHASSRFTLINSLVADNTANNTGGIYMYDAVNDYDEVYLTCYNSIVYNNVGANTSTASEISNPTTFGVKDIQYSLVKAENPTGVGNIDATVTSFDPLFRDAANGDYILQTGSPLIDAGLNSHNTESIDLAGNTRIVSSTIDIGAYEFIPTINTWQGTTNDWHTATNWSTGVVPVQAETVVIPSGLTTYPTSTTDVYFDNLTIEAGATYIPEGFVNIGGTVNTKINIADTNWHLIAPPVNSGTLDALLANHSFATGSGSNVGLATYDTTTDGWNYFNASSTGSTPITEGMSIKLTAADDVTFTGSIHQSDYSATLSSGNTANFNLIGNPYTSYVNSATFLSDNNNGQLSQQTIWLWNGTSYQTLNMNTAMEIAPGQGFFVEFDPSSIFNTSANFSTANRSHQNTNTFLRQEVATNFELSVSNGSKETSTAVYYRADKTTGFDNGYDSKMFGGTSYDFAIFTELVSDNAGDKLAIQTLANEDTSVIPVGIIAKAGEELSFSVASINLPAGTSVYLEDTKNGAFVNLSETTYKTTLSEDSTTTGQFYIHTSAKSLSTKDVIGLDKVSIYKSSNSQVTITGLQSDAAVSLYSLLGKEVMTTNISSKGVSTVNLPSLSTGVYIVKLASENGTITKKITLN